MSNKLVSTTLNELVEQEKRHNAFRSTLQNLLDIPMSAEMKHQLLEEGVNTPDDTLMAAVSGAVVVQALRGNVNAYTTIRDTMGYKPVDQVQNDVTVRVEMSAKAKELGE